MYSIQTSYSFDPATTVRGQYETSQDAWRAMLAEAANELVISERSTPSTMHVDPVNGVITLEEQPLCIDTIDTTTWEVIENKKED